MRSRTYSKLLFAVLVLTILAAGPVLAEVSLIVNSVVAGPLSVTVTAPDGAVLTAGDDDGDSTVTLALTQGSGTYQLTVAVGARRESSVLAVPKAGTVSVLYDPDAEAGPLSVDVLVQSAAITVTAQKREEELQDVPISISAVTAEKLEDLGADSFTDYARTIPGLTFVDRGPNQNRVVIRGVSPLAGQSTIALYIDGLSVSSSFNQPDLKLFDAERVEVLRGPQGTLYGEGAMGGTINIINNKPDPSGFDSKVELTASDTSEGGGNSELSAMVNVPVVEDKFAIRLVAYNRDYDGWIDNPILGVERLNDIKMTGARLTGRWIASEKALWTFSANIEDLEQGGANQVNFLLGDLEASEDIVGFNDDKIETYSLEFNYDFGGTEFTAIAGVLQRDTRLEFDVGFGPDFPAGFASDQQVTTGEFRLASTRPGPWTWVVGAFYKKWDQDNRLFSDGFPLFPGFQTRFDAVAQFDTEIRALFGEATYDFNERLSGTIGLRSFEQEQRDIAVTSLTDLGIVIDQSDLAETFSDVSPKLGLAYDVSDDSKLFFTIAKGYRAGGVNPLNVTNPEAPRGYDADYVLSYEFGFKTSTPDGRAVVNGAIYHMDWEDLQILGVPENSLLGFTTNAGEAKSDGVELEVDLQPIQGLTVNLGGTYIEAVLEESAQGGVPGDRLPFVPRYTYSAAVQYEFPLTSSLNGVVRGDYSRRGRIFREVTNDPLTELASYHLENLRFGVEADRWAAYLFVENLGDVRADLDRNDVVFFHRNRPRTVGLTLRLRPRS